MSCNWNDFELYYRLTINWRASLVPAAAAIPASGVYISLIWRLLGEWEVRLDLGRAQAKQIFCRSVDFSLFRRRFAKLCAVELDKSSNLREIVTRWYNLWFSVREDSRYGHFRIFH